MTSEVSAGLETILVSPKHRRYVSLPCQEGTLLRVNAQALSVEVDLGFGVIYHDDEEIRWSVYKGTMVHFTEDQLGDAILDNFEEWSSQFPDPRLINPVEEEAFLEGEFEPWNRIRSWISEHDDDPHLLVL